MQAGLKPLRQRGVIDLGERPVRVEDGARQRDGLDGLAVGLLDRRDLGREEFFRDRPDDCGALDTGDDEPEGSVGQRDAIDHTGGNADRMERIHCRIIVGASAAA